MSFDIPSYTPLECSLQDIRPISFICIQRENPSLMQYFDDLCAENHYLSSKNPKGNYLSYLVTTQNSNVIACLMFSQPAWKLKPRESYIGWNEAVKKENLKHLLNNSRFVILKDIKIRNLATYILGQVQKRVSEDWSSLYGEPIYMLETFVDESRNDGACYKADNWTRIGDMVLQKGNKELIGRTIGVYLKPLCKNAIRLLTIDV